MMQGQWKNGALGLAVLWAVCGCAGQALHRSGMERMAAGDMEAGLAALAQAVQAAPRDAALRKDYQLAKLGATGTLLQSAQQKQAQDDFAGAEAELRRLQALDPANGAAAQALQNLRRAAQTDATVAEARKAHDRGDTGQASALLVQALADDPRHLAALELQRLVEQPRARAQFADVSLRESHPQPVNLDFRDAGVRQVLEALSHTTDINFIFDKDVPADVRTTVILRNANIDEAVSLILRNSQLRSKVLNRNTVQIYPDTPEKRRENQELVVRAFYLQDAGAVQIQTVLKSLLKLKDIVIDERLNLVTVRDTPEAIRLAERLVALHDLAEPEVMLELEVLEVQRDDLLKLGVQWPNQFTVVPLASGGLNLTLDELKRLNSTRLGVAFNNPSVNLRQDASLTNLLANPRIRVHNREKANILIGDKVPVITTTSNATGFVAENVQYLDVGLKLAAEPVIHPSSDVSIRLNLEVSSIASQVSTPNGTVAYQVGTRNASTFLRLRDGETQVLAGLISDQDRRSASGVPGLSRLPLLGRLFTAPTDSATKTEIVLSITPHVVRPPARAAAQPVEFWSGTESSLDVKPLRLGEAAQGSAVAASTAAPPAAVPVAPQFVWSGPNQVKPGDEFTLSLRAIAPLPAGALGLDVAGLELLDARGGSDAGPNTVTFEQGTRTAGVNLTAPVNGQLLSLTLRAPAAAGQASVRLAGPAAPASPYLITVQP